MTTQIALEPFRFAAFHGRTGPPESMTVRLSPEQTNARAIVLAYTIPVLIGSLDALRNIEVFKAIVDHASELYWMVETDVEAGMKYLSAGYRLRVLVAGALGSMNSYFASAETYLDIPPEYRDLNRDWSRDVDAFKSVADPNVLS